MVSNHFDDQSNVRTYRPRRKRSDNPPGFQLTPRDIEIVKLVAEHRFLNSDHIRQMVAGSDRNISNRLKGLFEHGFLDRPECQYDTYRIGGGSKLLAYALADKGARLLADQQTGKRISWTDKNKRVGRPFLEHTLAIADFAVALESAANQSKHLELLSGDDQIAALPPETATLAKPFRVNVPVINQKGRQLVGVEPDYAFSLKLTKHNRRAHFLVEVDRGTMPVERFDLKQTSILRKLLAYQTLWKSKIHEHHFGWKNFRVLFVTTCDERAANMIAATEGHILTRGSPLFLYADKHALYCHDNLLSHDWHDSYGNPQRLVPKKWM